MTVTQNRADRVAAACRRISGSVAGPVRDGSVQVSNDRAFALGRDGTVFMVDLSADPGEDDKYDVLVLTLAYDEQRHPHRDQDGESARGVTCAMWCYFNVYLSAFKTWGGRSVSMSFVYCIQRPPNRCDT